jgi:hypothetical protein
MAKLLLASLSHSPFALKKNGKTKVSTSKASQHKTFISIDPTIFWASGGQISIEKRKEREERRRRNTDMKVLTKSCNEESGFHKLTLLTTSKTSAAASRHLNVVSLDAKLHK